MQYIKKYPLLLLFLLAATWQLFLIYFLQLNHQNLIYPDSESYLKASRYLYYLRDPHHHRPIGMSFITGIPWVFKATQNTVVLWSWMLNLISWLLTIFLIYKIVKTSANYKIAFIVSVVYLLCVGPAIVTMHVLSETYYVLLLVLAMYCLQKFHFKKEVKYLFFAICVIAISMLFRPVSKFILFFLLILYSKDIFAHFRSKYALLMYVGFGLIILQCGMNYAKYGNFKVSYIDTYTMYLYIGAQAEAKAENISYKDVYDSRYQPYLKTSFIERETIANSDFKKQLTKNTGNLFTSLFENIYENSTDFSSTLRDISNVKDNESYTNVNSFLRSIASIQNILFSILAIVLVFVICFKVLFVKTYLFFEQKFEVFIALTIAYLILASGVSFGQGDRFHIVLFSLVIVLLVNSTKKYFKFSA